jgi:hypothetical protein
MPTNTAGSKMIPGKAILAPVSWERMINAVEKVRQRLARAVAALEAKRVPYALVGGNAVAAWVARVDESAVRNTQDVDILLRRTDFQGAIEAMSKAGFIYRHVKSIDMFLDGPAAKARDAVHVVFADEKVKADSIAVSPDVDESEQTSAFRLLNLEALVRMELTSFRDKERTQLRDLLDVGLVDGSWCGHLPVELGSRLQQLIDSPEG